MRATPSNTKRPCPKVMAAVKGRIAVPAFPSINVASDTGIIPAVPETEMRFSARFSSNSIPSVSSASTILRMSSLSSKF